MARLRSVEEESDGGDDDDDDDDGREVGFSGRKTAKKPRTLVSSPHEQLKATFTSTDAQHKRDSRPSMGAMYRTS
jgi:hypothetical protein